MPDDLRDQFPKVREVVAALGFLGFSPNPNAANWGQMINENRLALSTQPWAVLAPVIIIASAWSPDNPRDIR